MNIVIVAIHHHSAWWIYILISALWPLQTFVSFGYRLLLFPWSASRSVIFFNSFAVEHPAKLGSHAHCWVRMDRAELSRAAMV